jgi:two-component system, NarL family, nitrate/nitrite response regulator NarL
MIRVVISASVRLYREGLAEILSRPEGIDVVGSAGSPLETAEVIERLRPDVVVLDATAPGGLDEVRQLARGNGDAKLVVLTVSDEEADLIAYAEAGVSGFITHEDSPAELTEAIRSVARGELRCSPRLAGTLLRRVTTLAADRPAAPGGVRFTPRELEVFRLLYEGLSNKQIAARLHIELPTVKHHVHHILEKLDVGRRGEAVARARRDGLLAGPEDAVLRIDPT